MRRENAATVKAVVTGMVLVGVLLAGTRVFAQDKYAVITANKNDMIICACFNPASKVQSMEIQIAHFVNGNPNVIDTTNGNLLSLKEMHADQYAPAGDPDHPANSIYACRAIDTGMADVDFPQLRCTLSVMNSSEGAIDSVLLTPHQD